MGGNIGLNQTTFAGVLSALVIDADKDFGGFNITNLGAGGHNLNTKLGYLDQDVKIAASPTFVGLTLSGLTQGSVLFAGVGGVISQDNANLFWDNVNNRLGIREPSPSQALDLIGNLELEDTSATDEASCGGIIYKGANAFIHNFHHPTGDTAVPVGRNTFIGINAGNFTMGAGATETDHASRNIAIGYQTLYSNTSGFSNTAIGYRALRLNTIGYYNVAIGSLILDKNTSGYSNVAIGSLTLYNNTSGYSNVAIGYYPLHFNTTGYSNIAIGFEAGRGVADSSDVSNNVFIGHQAGLAVKTGADSNTLIGYQAGDIITTGASNIMIGSGTDPVNPTDSNKLNIGNTIYGDLSAGNVGIGTASPAEKLDVNGIIRGSSSQSSGALGSELVANGTFDSDLTGWAGANWAWVAGEASHTAGVGNTDALTQNITIVNGTTYHITIKITDRTVGSVTLDVNGVYIYKYTSVTALTSNETYNRSLVGNATGLVTLSITPTADFDGDVDDISVKAISASTPNVKLVDDSGDVAIEIRGDAGLFNIFLGKGAGRLNTIGNYNVAMGTSALHSNTIGSYNAAIGYQTLASNSCGYSNLAIGSNALRRNTTGRYNMAIGYQALYYNTTGEANLAIGRNCLLYNTTGVYNAAIGSTALYSNTIGGRNMAIGSAALYSNTTGSYNAAIGYQAGYAISIGANYNTLIGYQAGDSITTGSSNIMIGSNTDPVNPTDSNKLNIGDTIYGDLSAGNVGIGTTLPQGKLHVGDQATNYLKVAADGEIGLVGTARVERHWLIDPTRFKLPGANYPAESFEGLFYTLDFDKSTDESAYCEEHVPYRWDSSTDIEVEVWWLHDSVDAGVAVWGIEYLSIKEDETVGAAGTTITQASAGNHTAGELQKTTFTTKILHANLEAHDAIAIRLFRDADNGSDTLAEDARVVNVCFHFIMNKLGQAT